MARWASVFAAAFVAGAVGTGCAVDKDEGDRFRDPVPQQDDVALRVPGGQGGGTTGQGLRIATNGVSAGTARYYQYTRNMTSSVDAGTAQILGSIWAVVSSTPTTVEAKRAVWGPGQGNALEPTVWQFTVNEVGDAEYDYVLEGRPRAGGAPLTVLRGHGFGKSRPEHRSGWFEADNDAYRTLDPAREHDYGTTKVTYDLRTVPATIGVELRAGADKGTADVLVTHDTAGAGSVQITAHADIDDSKATKLEDVRLISRWTKTGSGRADIQLKNGDLPVTVDATECWSDSFARVFYTDTVNYEPATGDATACALPAAKL